MRFFSRSLSKRSRSFSAFSNRSLSFSAFSRSFSAFSRSFSARSRSTLVVFFSDSELSRRLCFFTRFAVELLVGTEGSFEEVANATLRGDTAALEKSSTSEEGDRTSSAVISSLDARWTLGRDDVEVAALSSMRAPRSSRGISPDIVKRLSSSEVISSGDLTAMEVEKETARGEDGRSGSRTWMDVLVCAAEASVDPLGTPIAWAGGKEIDEVEEDELAAVIRPSSAGTCALVLGEVCDVEIGVGSGT